MTSEVENVSKDGNFSRQACGLVHAVKPREPMRPAFALGEEYGDGGPNVFSADDSVGRHVACR